jgi:uncharacterized protein (DUF4415 family)
MTRFGCPQKLAPLVSPMPNISLRLSQEVLDFFKTENPKGYTAKMASVLATYMQAHQQK